MGPDFFIFSMYNVNQLQEALGRIFGERPPRKALTVQKICSVLADYYDCQPENIAIAELKAALRELPFAVPQTKLRGSGHVNWFFVKRDREAAAPAERPVKKTRRYKDKPLAKSQKLKGSK